MKFCDMPYERIDVKAATEALDAAAERLSAAKTIEEAEEAFSEREKIISHVQTMSTIAYIRHTVNTLDEFYEKENDFNDENAPLIEQSVGSLANCFLTKMSCLWMAYPSPNVCARAVNKCVKS